MPASESEEDGLCFENEGMIDTFVYEVPNVEEETNTEGDNKHNDLPIQGSLF